ncbi:MAG: aldehyde dehydrogenase family protein, partial [Solirubrobacterales bacterium]|nr:aldehyde dehydrogenase family protein [Solirubrobacterales bacterium]
MSTVETTYPGSFIAGEPHRNAGDPLEVVNPAEGRAFASVAAASATDVDAAVQAAAAAFGAWSALAVSKRGEILGRAAHHVEEHLDELIPLLTREQGKTLRDSRIEISKAIDTLIHYVGLSKSLRGAHTPGLDPGVDGFVLRRPLGVVGAIVPWNFPTTLLCNKLAPALIAGNTVVAKPAGTTPLTTLRFAELLADGGLPEGVFNVVTGRGSEAGDALVTHPEVRKIAFTGSTPVGERIMAQCALGVKRITLELGGSDPMIICDDADLDAAASAASMGRFYNCGQACLAIKRVYVFESVADEVVEAIVAKAKRLKVGR